MIKNKKKELIKERKKLDEKKEELQKIKCVWEQSLTEMESSQK